MGVGDAVHAHTHTHSHTDAHSLAKDTRRELVSLFLFGVFFVRG